MKREVLFFYILGIAFLIQDVGSVWNLTQLWHVANFGLRLQQLASIFTTFFISMGMFFTARQMQRSGATDPAFQDLFNSLQKNADVKGGKRK